MRLKGEYLLQKVAGEWLGMPVGKTATEFNGMLTMNETGAAIFRLLQTGEDAKAGLERIAKQYGARFSDVEEDYKTIMGALKGAGLLDEA